MFITDRRLQLHNLLKTLGTDNVYFQPPANVQMQYPCIVYKRDQADTKFAGNYPYNYTQRYQVTVIDTNPDGGLLSKVASLPMCLFNRFFTANDLNHDVFVLYF